MKVLDARPMAMLGGLAAILVIAACVPHPSRAQSLFGPRPKPVDLTKTAPFDRLTLADSKGTVLVIEPLSPRPLPPPEAKRKSIDPSELTRRAVAKRKGNVDPFDRAVEDLDDMVTIHLLEGDQRDFMLKRSSIKDVEYFEDMLLAEGDRLVRSGDFTRAFERFLLVKTRQPDWKGLDDHVNRLLFEEASVALAEDNARGLRLLGDLYLRKPDYPGLGDKLAASYVKRVDKAVAVGRYAEGRRLLRELDQAVPGHPEAKAARDKFINRARDLVAKAARSEPDVKVDRLTEAAKIWPALEGLDAAYREGFRGEPTVTVGVVDLADPVGPFPRSPAAERVARLLYLPVLARDDDESLAGETPGQLLSGLELTELGRGLKLSLKPGPPWSDGSRPASSIDVARSLADRALPASPGYCARWAELLDPVGPAHGSSDGWVSTPAKIRKPVGDGPFRWEPASEGTTVLRASGEPSAGGVIVRRIREVRLSNPGAAVDALRRGEVDLVERIPPDKVGEVTSQPDLRAGKYETPSVHLIALDGRSPALANRTVRRAISLVINRKTWLEEAILHRPLDEINRVADGPVVAGSYLDAPKVAPLDYDPLLAKGLVNSAKKELGLAILKLDLEYPPLAEARVVCPLIAEALGLVGIEVKLIERRESELETRLRSGQRFQMAYRAIRSTLPLRDVGPLLVPGYDAPPAANALASAASPRIRGLLLQLDHAPEPTAARLLATQIDREARDELPVIPLWQVEDHYAWRTNLRGPGESASGLYQGIERWEVEAWLAKDPG
jgi:peptide/nickel transport system substrate-binding protein